jgi:hypothetical protein
MNTATETTFATSSDLLMFAGNIGAGVDVVREDANGRCLLLITLGDRAIVFDCNPNTGHDGLAVRHNGQETPVALTDAVALVHARIAAVVAWGRALMAERTAYNMMGVE